jgi:hypothetical protein
MNWFKLVGATEDQVHEHWDEDESEMFTRVHFSAGKPPTSIFNKDRMVLYAVGSKVLIATQTVVASPGVHYTDGRRWPWEITVTTHDYCAPLSKAPKLREHVPEVAERYAKKFWEGSHWEIDDGEYEQLASAVAATGRPYQP